MVTIATKHENLLKEKDRKHIRHDVNFFDGYEFRDEVDQPDYAEAVVAKMVIHRPYTCQALKPAKGKEKLKENVMSIAKDA